MNKFNKGKLIGFVAASLSAVSLMGVGFASWVLTGTNNMGTTGNITVNVGAVEDKRVLIQSAVVDNDNNTVAFDANSNGSGDLGIGGTGDQAEDRTFALTYVVRVHNGMIGGAWNVKAQLTGNADNYKIAVNTKKYITMPTEIGLDTEQVSVSSTSTDQTGKLKITKSTDSATTGYTDWTVKQTFEFGWGDAFAGKNPINITKNDNIILDGATSTVKADADKVVTNINGLKDLPLSNFTITLTTYIG